MLAKEDTGNMTSEEICNNGFMDHIKKKINNEVIGSFNNMSAGKFSLYILPLNQNGDFSVTDDNQLQTGAIFMFYTKITITDVGQGKDYFQNK